MVGEEARKTTMLNRVLTNMRGEVEHYKLDTPREQSYNKNNIAVKTRSDSHARKSLAPVVSKKCPR